MRFRTGLAVLGLLAIQGCRGCICTNAARTLAAVAPESVAVELTKERLDRAPTSISTLCGVSASALKDVKLEQVRTSGHIHYISVEGTAVRIPGDAGPPPDEEVDAGDEDDAGDEGSEDAAALPLVDGSVARAGATRVVRVDPLAVVLCVGVISVTISPILGKEGLQNGWYAGSIAVESVATAGVVFAKPTVSSGSHHHHRHHHH